MHENVVERAKFGFLPLMAGCCDGKIGAVNAESIAERILTRIIYYANLAMADGNTPFNDKTRNLGFSLCCV
jgi:hypothetical protein